MKKLVKATCITGVLVWAAQWPGVLEMTEGGGVEGYIVRIIGGVLMVGMAYIGWCRE